MTRLGLLLVIGLLANPVLAQEDAKTLLSGKIEHGGYGGPQVTLSGVNGEFSILTGIRGGWIINHTFVLGAGGYNLQNEVKADVESRNLEMNYGGLHFEYIVHSDRLIHYYFQSLIGTGKVNYSGNEFVNNEDSESDWFWVIQPAFYIELNIVKFFRTSVGISYRYVNDIDLPTYPTPISTDLDSHSCLNLESFKRSEPQEFKIITGFINQETTNETRMCFSIDAVGCPRGL